MSQCIESNEAQISLQKARDFGMTGVSVLALSSSWMMTQINLSVNVQKDII